MLNESVSGLHARLVFDGVLLSDAKDRASRTQCQGTVLEVLCELAGRECYDSLGAPNSRPSSAYHQHILEVQHLSVYEHANFTVLVKGALDADLLLDFLNRPGLFVRVSEDDPTALRLTMNLRTVLDWHLWESASGHRCPCPPGIQNLAHKLAPQIVKRADNETRHYLSIVPPEYDEERWISIRLTGSRGFSHEMVRHRFRTAVSQRSTRYVDESESLWARHPGVSLFANELRARIERLIGDSQALYRDAVQIGQEKLVDRGCDKFTARKQARGAARGFLGNALTTSMIFSASVAQWRRMLSMRLTDAADAEIREVFALVLPELMMSNYRDRFQDLTLRQSSDGLGRSLG